MHVSSNVLATRKWHCPVLANLFHTAVLPVFSYVFIVSK